MLSGDDKEQLALVLRWQLTLREVGVEDPGDQALHTIIRRYREPHRHYHTLRHLAHCHELLDRSPSPSAAVRLAIWYHDIVYDTHRNDNEEASAMLARSELARLRFPPPLIEKVAGLILATDHSRKHAPSPEADLLCDLDLAILGASPEEYREYAANIRREYEWVPEPDYRAGRATVLSSFLNRESIYATREFRDRLESHARKNLEREREALTR